MNVKEFVSEEEIKKLQRHIAFSSIGPTTLRNMLSVKGWRSEVCSQLGAINLNNLNSLGFEKAIDKWTDDLVLKTKCWGASRKALNLFLRDLYYNYWIRNKYNLDNFAEKFEIPLDGIVMNKIRKIYPSLPKKPAVKNLTADINKKYQLSAYNYAKDNSTLRIHLDIKFWSGGLSGG